jgi:hypothetical protein
MEYDVIGDIHGHAGKLAALLRTLGYRERAGAWRHPDPGRAAIFVGDFIDRGPGQLATIAIVRGMLDAGTAQAVMGNHEFNAVAWHTPDRHAAGGHLRKRNGRNQAQHAAFLGEAAHDPALHQELVDWFLALPVWLDLPGLRVVHACWSPDHVARLQPLLRPGNRLDLALVEAASRRGTLEYEAIETLLKGPEIELPAGHSFLDPGGVERTRVRLRWWDATARTYREAGIANGAQAQDLPDLPIPPASQGGYAGDKPVLFGHYWESGTPRVQSPSAACVDYSACKGGPLVAYRWQGEHALRDAHFVCAGAAAAA